MFVIKKLQIRVFFKNPYSKAVLNYCKKQQPNDLQFSTANERQVTDIR